MTKITIITNDHHNLIDLLISKGYKFMVSADTQTQLPSKISINKDAQEVINEIRSEAATVYTSPHPKKVVSVHREKKMLYDIVYDVMENDKVYNKHDVIKIITAKGFSKNSASPTLNDLYKLNMVERVKEGRMFYYSKKVIK